MQIDLINSTEGLLQNHRNKGQIVAFLKTL